MTKKKSEFSESDKLRKLTEKKSGLIDEKYSKSLTPEESQSIVSELRTHQIELEIQNDELRSTYHKLELLTARYIDLFNQAPVGYISLNENSEILEVNTMAADLLFEDKGSICGKKFMQYIHPDDQDIFYMHRKNIYRTDKSPVCEIRLLRKNIAILWVSIVETVVKDENDKLIYRVILSDITGSRKKDYELTKKNDELIEANTLLQNLSNKHDKTNLVLLSILEDEKNARAVLLESEERYITFINATEDIAFLKDEQLRYIVTNKKHVMITGKPADEILGKTDFDLLPHNTALQCIDSDRLVLQKNTTIVSEETLDDRIYETRKFPVKLRNEKIGIGCYIRDVTYIRQAAKDIEKSAKEWQITFDSIEDVIWLLDSDFKVLRANSASEKILGISPADLVGKHCWSMVHGTDKPVDNCPVSRLRNSLKPETSIMKLNNLWFSVTVYPIFGENKTLAGIVHTMQDITGQRESHEALLLRSTAIENAANAIVITDKNGIILWANPAFEKLTLYSLSEAVGLNPRDIIKSGLHDNKFYKEIWDTILSGRVWNGEIINKRKDGTFYTEEMTIAPVNDSDGEIKNFIAIKQDVTDRKFALDLLNTRLELINYSNDHSLEELLIYTLNEVERITGSKISFFHFLEEDQQTLSLQAWSNGTSEKFCKAEGKGMHYNIADAGVWVDCVRERRTVVHNDYISLQHRKGLPEGHAEVVRQMVIPIIRDDKIKAILGVGNKNKDYLEQDISVATYLADIAWGIVEKKRDEEQLKQFNAELETKVSNRTTELKKMNNALESFSYSISHDLRAPIRHITGFIELLKKEMEVFSNQKISHHLEVIEESANRMNLLIDDLLSYSQMGRTTFSRQNVNMETLVSDILNEYSCEIESRNISFTRYPLPEVKGDRAMLRIVLVNLISNAIKYTGKSNNPAIEIGYKIVDNENTFYISDNGAGFDMLYADKLFGVFQRLHSDKEFKGTGIGLAMVKGIIERHKGSVWAKSEPDHGACFYFTLPDRN